MLMVCSAAAHAATSAITFPGQPLEAHSASKQWTASYCPDNTCERLVFSRSMSETEVRSASLAYFVFHSQYAELEHWQKVMKLDDQAQKLIRRLRGKDCRANELSAIASCRLRTLVQAGRLDLYFVRYDEGIEAVEKIRLPDPKRRD